MSLILDALKRADAERSRGSVPGLHAQTLASAPPPATRGRNGWWIALAALAVVALLATLAWQFGTRRQAPAVTPAPTTSAAPVTPPVTAPVPAPAPPLVQVPPVTAPAPAPAAPPASVSVPAPAPAPARVAKPASAPLAEERVPSLAELPDDVRKQIPPLVITGSIYSPNPGQRLLTIGSQVFQEGDRPAPDLVLERIQQKSAVFSFRGQRYSVAF